MVDRPAPPDVSIHQRDFGLGHAPGPGQEDLRPSAGDGEGRSRPGVDSRAFHGHLLSLEHSLDVAAIVYRSQCACLVLEEQPALRGNSLKRAE